MHITKPGTIFEFRNYELEFIARLTQVINHGRYIHCQVISGKKLGWLNKHQSVTITFDEMSAGAREIKITPSNYKITARNNSQMEFIIRKK